MTEDADIRDRFRDALERLPRIDENVAPIVDKAARIRRRRRILAATIAAVAVAGLVVPLSLLLSLEGSHPAPTVSLGHSPSGAARQGDLIVYECPGYLYASNTNNPNLCTMRPDGSDRRLLLGSPFVERDPAWSPDGSRIAYRGYYGLGDGQYDLYVVNADGDGVRRLTNGRNGSDPAWSLDGSRIAFDTSGNGSIDTIRPDGSGLRSLTAGVKPCFTAGSCPKNRGFEDLMPSWSPDGSKIVFARMSRNRDGLWVMGADGTDPHELVNSSMVGGDVGEPAWSPDGRWIGFSVQDSASSSTIWVIGASGDAPRMVSPGASENWNPQWIDAGAQIAFLHGSAQGADLDAVGADGSHLHTLIASFPGQRFSFQPVPVVR